jgi:hypothetical protein
MCGTPQPGNLVVVERLAGSDPGGTGDGRDGADVHLTCRAPLLSVYGAEMCALDPHHPLGARLVLRHVVQRRLGARLYGTGVIVSRALLAVDHVHDAVVALADAWRLVQGQLCHWRSSTRHHRTHPHCRKHRTEARGVRPEVHDRLR